MTHELTTLISSFVKLAISSGLCDGICYLNIGAPASVEHSYRVSLPFTKGKRRLDRFCDLRDLIVVKMQACHCPASLWLVRPFLD